MRPLHYALILASTLAAVPALAQQPLVCPTAPAGRPCDAYHFHVGMYRPDTRQFIEVFGGTAYATQAACDRARELHLATTTRAAEYMRSIKEQLEPDRVGPCHCDMTNDKASPTYQTEAQRTAQMRTAEEIRLRVRERLLDHKLTSDSAIVRALWEEPPVTPLLGGPKLAPLPQAGPAPVLTASEELRATKTLDTSKPVMAAMDLPLLEVGAAAPPAPAPASQPGETTEPAPASSAAPATTPQPATAFVDTPPAQEPVEEVVVPQPAVTEPEPAAAIETETGTEPETDIQSAEETAEKFVSYETERIQNVLRAAGAIADENVKSKIFEAAMQRIQLLSNLRLLIEGSGMRSRLAAAARNAQEESDRLALVARLFGEDMKEHWAPQDAADVIFEVDPGVAAEPERALRDTTGSVTTEQKRHALYLVLAQSQPTEDQRLWLSSIVEDFLR